MALVTEEDYVKTTFSPLDSNTQNFIAEMKRIKQDVIYKNANLVLNGYFLTIFENTVNCCIITEKLHHEKQYIKFLMAIFKWIHIHTQTHTSEDTKKLRK